MQSNKSKTIILNSIAITLVVSIGVGVGYILSTVFPYFKKEVDYDSLDANYLKANGNECLKKFEKTKSNGNPFDGKSMQGWELINAALCKFESASSNKSQGIGVAYAKVGPMSVDQQIRSTMYRVNDEYFEESLSKSFAVNVAWRMYEKDGETKRYKGNCPSDVEKPSFSGSEEPAVYTNDQYLDYAGRNLSGSSTIYIISNKTLASEEQKSLSGLPFDEIISNSDDTYTINLELDARKAVVNYVKQMTATTAMNGKPVFDYVHVSFVLTSDCELVSSVSTEKYFASTPSGSSNITGTLKTVYSTGGNYVIPSPGSNEAIDYTH